MCFHDKLNRIRCGAGDEKFAALQNLFTASNSMCKPSVMAVFSYHLRTAHASKVSSAFSAPSHRTSPANTVQNFSFW